MSEGLRERKKRLTRRRIAEVALGLFVERGFDQVTIAEVADAADVSVNTVYNYFATKEDLALPPEEASPDRLADIVRGRAPGESAAVAVLGRLRAEVRRRDRAVGLTDGFGRVLAMMLAAPTLAARLEDLSGRMVDRLAELLAAETGAAEGDPVPRLVAGQLGWCHSVVFGEIGRRTVAGEDPALIAEAALSLLDAIEDLLGERVLTYAARMEEA
ncbi:TetR/AcrR family transcriptional regulator [Amycolatopsis albispora]|uniref:TetR family transcriptional regulator n=1 Tax=Amycolatopsis albispora TaxID=1804986 RepID=A0A344L2G0_9PSEU|nr:TetR/AcrR family transcriptional regulator [Amycolatopsis albispora]AXB42234.1 TetR family transcriptional regulator [Amycolatopsis albispora]